MENEKNIILYNTDDGKAAVRLIAKDGSVWMNQNELAELFATSRQNISQHISNVLEERELNGVSVVKKFFTTASDGKHLVFNYDETDGMNTMISSQNHSPPSNQINHS